MSLFSPLKKGKYLGIILGLTTVLALVSSVFVPGAQPAQAATKPTPGVQSILGGTLKIFKFTDLDGDKVYEATEGETPLAGWHFDITGPSSYSSSGDTDAFGLVTKAGLEPGEYHVTETLKAGWTCTTDNPQTGTVNAGETTTLSFGNQQKQTLVIFKFKDLNGDKDYDPGQGDMLLSGWQFSITGTGYSSSGTTNSSGLIIKTGLAPGQYTVRETVKAGWICTTDNPQTAAVSADGTTRLVFGNQPLGTLKIFKFNDLDGDEAYEPGQGETPLAGWQFNITGPGYSSSGTTNASGLITKTNLVPGEYHALETVKDGWKCTTDNPQSGTVTSGGTTTLSFGNQQKQTLVIFKFNDLDGDENYDPGQGETPLSGWQFNITGPGGYSSSGTTNSFGLIIKTGLALGDYTVTETVKAGWKCTTDNPQTGTVISSGNTRLEFGNQQLQTLVIVKFNDLNGDGDWGEGEPPLSGWRFTITRPGGYSSSGTTNSSGLIIKTGLALGDYTVTETVKAGWRCTTGNPQTGTVISGGTTRLVFGNQQLGTLKIFKFKDRNGDGHFNPWDGDTLLPGWQFDITGPDGYESSDTTNSIGQIIKTNLVPGDYTAEETVQPSWECTTDNPQTGTVTPGGTTILVFGNSGPIKIVFTTDPQTVTAGQVSSVMTIQTQYVSGTPLNVVSDTTINLGSTHSLTGKFSLKDTPWVDITHVTITSGTNSADFYYKDTTAGTPTITAAESPDQGWADGTQQETINPAAASRLEVTGNATMTAGGNNELTITAKDQYGNVDTSYTGAKNLTFSGPGNAPDGTQPTVEGTTIGNVTSVSFTNGVSNANAATLIAYKAEITTVDVSDGSINSFGNAAYDLDLTVNPAAIDHYWISHIDVPVEAEVAGVPFSVTIQAQDAYDNDITSGADAAETVDITLGLPDGGATPISVVTALGTVTFNMTMTVAQDDQSLVFTGETSGKSGTSNDFDVDPGAISQIVFTTIAQTITIDNVSGVMTIQTRDTYGNPSNVGSDTTIDLSSSSAGTYEFYSDSGGLYEITSVTITNGTNSASFYYEDDTVGNPTITAAENPSQGWTDGTQQETIVGPI